MRSLAGERSTVDAQPLELARRLFLAHAGDLHRYASRRVGCELADDVAVSGHGDRYVADHGA